MTNSRSTLQLASEARLCILASSVIEDETDPVNVLLMLLSGPLSRMHGKIFVSEELSIEIEKDYGWKISTDTIDYLVPKMRSQNWLIKNNSTASANVLYVDLPEPDSGGVNKSNIEPESILSEMGRLFIEFSNNISPLSIIPSDPLEAGMVLLRRVISNELEDSLSGKASNKNSEERFLTSRFIEEEIDNNPELESQLARLKAIGFVMAVADDIAKPKQRKYTDLTVILDGPLLLDTLNCSGLVRKSAIDDLIHSLRLLKVNIATFTHCVDEARVALSAVLKRNSYDRFGPTGDALRRGDVRVDVLKTTLTSFESLLDQANISIYPDSLDTNPNSHQFFSREKVEAVEQIVNWHDSENTHAIERDADTVAFVVRRRIGQRTNDIFASKFVAVTSNDAFTGSIRRHLLETMYYNSGQVLPIINLRELAARTWLEVGITKKNGSNIPKSQLLRSCGKVALINEKAIARARDELSKIDPEKSKQFELLLQLPRSARAAADLILNDEKYATGPNSTLMLEAAIKAAGESEAAKERAKAEKREAKLTSSIDELSSLAEQNKGELQHHQQQLLQSDERDREYIIGVLDRWNRRKKIALTVFRIIAIIVALVALVVGIRTFSTNANLVELAIYVSLGLFAVLFAFDKPGSFWKKLTENFCEKRAKNDIYESRRGDLLEKYGIIWQSGELDFEQNTVPEDRPESLDLR